MPSMRQPRRARPLACALTAAVALLLAGCGEPGLVSPEAEPGTPPTGTPATGASRPEASPVPLLGEVVWATSADPVTNAPLNEITSIPPDAPRIAAFVLASSLPPGSTVQADWEYNDTSLDAFALQIVVPTGTDQTWLSFYLDRGEAESWPSGVYEVTLSIDGRVARQAAVAVAAAP